MDFESLERPGLIESIGVDLRRAISNLKRAEKDLETAHENLGIDIEWAFTIAYHAMLRAGRALMLAKGYRPKGKEQHRTVVAFVDIVLGPEFKNLVNRFDKMRRRRHDFIYDVERPISKFEVEKSMADSKLLIGAIEEIITDMNPQASLLDE
jgi:uncharacterized protein (UPF0332 family)